MGSLDGVRGLALAAVLVYHARATALPGGFLGVEMFFVLSGYLLTSLLLDEHSRTGVIDKVAYARRRLRRIVPGLFVMLTALAILGAFIVPEGAHRLGRDIVASLAGVTNWYLIHDGSSYFGQTGRPPLVRHLWSIAVELQAYVLIPFLVSWLARKSRELALQVLGGGIVLAAGLMTILARTSSESRAYFGTDTRIGAILAGAFMAVLLSRYATASRTQLSERAVTLMAACGSLALVALFFTTNDRSGFLYPSGFLIAQVSTALLLVSTTRPGLGAETLSSAPLRWLGTRSYGIYLWHWPIVAMTRPDVDVDWAPITSAVVGIGAAVGLGALSYRFVERPFFGDTPLPWPKAHVRAGGLAWASAMAALLLLVGQSAPVDPIAASLAAGERALAAQDEELQSEQRRAGYGDDPPLRPGPDPRPGGYGDDPLRVVRTGAGRGSVGAARPFPLKGGPPKNSVRVTAMGDSVMLGAAPDLKDRFGTDSYVNAEKNRQWRQGIDAVKVFKAQGNLGRVLIVHLGNNGPGKPSDIDAIMKEVKGISRHVVFVTVRVTKPWQDTVNENIKSAAKRYPKSIVIANWYRMSEGHRDWFYSDGTHLTRAGAENYTKLLASSVPPDPKPKSKPTPTPEPTPTPGLLDALKPKPD